MNDAAEMSRLRWRCRRGMLELDLMLMAFLDKNYTQLELSQRHSFQKLLELSDQTLLDYLMGHSVVEQKEFADVIERIRDTVTPRG